ncbi:hypothetical protein GG344DRAFT_68049 [Lentinula edodes]|nr:hypothetical protein GG344DRAFT_68049 [Lentinula edodes]
MHTSTPATFESSKRFSSGDGTACYSPPEEPLSKPCSRRSDTISGKSRAENHLPKSVAAMVNLASEMWRLGEPGDVEEKQDSKWPQTFISVGENKREISEQGSGRNLERMCFFADGKQRWRYDDLEKGETEEEQETRKLGLEFRRSYVRYMRTREELRESMIDLDECLLCQKLEEMEELGPGYPAFSTHTTPLATSSKFSTSACHSDSLPSESYQNLAATAAPGCLRILKRIHQTPKISRPREDGMVSLNLQSAPTLKEITMTDSMEDLESLYRLRYLSGVALSVMVYDHLLTLNEEFSNIWAAPNRDYFQKLMFVINRYYTEAMVMLVADSSGFSLSLQQYSPPPLTYYRNCADWHTEAAVFITLRVYHSWDKRKRVAIILLVAFIIFMAAAAALAVISATDVQPAIHFVSFLKACMVPDIPITFPFMMGTLPFSTHSKDRTRRMRMSWILSTEMELGHSFAGGYHKIKAIFLLRLGCLIVSVVGMPADCFGALSVMWTLTAIISSRIHLRVEGLKFTTLAFGSSFLVI